MINLKLVLISVFLGSSLVQRLNINTLGSGYRNSYSPSIDPRMANEFATAAFRFGHSLVQGIYKSVPSRMLYIS